MAIPMPFQFRGGPSELPRSWYEKRETQNAVVDENIIAAGSIVSDTDISPWQAY